MVFPSAVGSITSDCVPQGAGICPQVQSPATVTGPRTSGETVAFRRAGLERDYAHV